MSEIRRGIFTDRWVIVEEGDGLQPTEFHFKKFARDTGLCPFCESNEAAPPPEVFAIRKPGSSELAHLVCGFWRLVDAASVSSG
jgi:UDPglucose--hexose-1-phosphate uridylyltransferase